MATEICVNIGTGNGLLHQAITWTNVDLSSARSKDIHLEEILWDMSQRSITKMNLKTTWLKLFKISQEPMS